MTILFRHIKEDDLSIILSWRMSPEVTKYMYTDPVLTITDQKIWFNKISDDSTRKDWIINIDSLDVGLLSVTGIDRINRRCYWAYYLGLVEHRGKGIGRNVEMNVCHYVFEVLDMNKLCCEVLSFNSKVIQIHQKYGSAIEGVRKAHIYKNSVFYDIVEMAILKQDWEEKIKGNFQFVNGIFEDIG